MSVSKRHKVFVVLFLMISIISGTSFAQAGDPDFLPPVVAHDSKIDNLPRWERIIKYYNMANLKSPTVEYEQWWDFIRSLKNDNKINQILKTNIWLNEFPYKQDNWIYSRDDHWATPSEFLKNGGDCEDYAIIKYMTLRRLGFPANQMKIVMVYDIYSGTDHAYLIMEQDHETYVLDSRQNSTYPDLYKKRYQAHYAFNENDVWTYESPKIVLKSRRNNSPDILPGNR